MAVVEVTTRVMASHVQLVVVDGPDGAAADALELLRTLEDRWSRFRPDSDITRLNTYPDQPVTVDEATIALVEAMFAAWRLTDGRYNPTVLPDLMRSGYTHSINDPSTGTLVDRRATTTGDPTTIDIDKNRGTVTLPVGISIDPGAIGKGLAADLVTGHLLDLGARGALASIGGDIVAAGAPPHGDGWTIGIENPLRPDSDIGTITIRGGGIATSSTHTRRWITAQGEPAHHLIDPATGTTADTDIAAVTVIGPSGWRAEAHATALTIATTTSFADYAAHHGLDAVAVTDAGAIHTTPALAPLATPEAAA